MAMCRRATRASLDDCGDLLRLLDEENVECESSSSEDSIFDLSDPEAGYKVASSPGPSQRGEKGLVHTDCACATLSVDFL